MPRMRISPTKFLICRYSDSKFFTATDSNSCSKASVRIVFSIMVFFGEAICCVFDQSFLSSVDGKNQSATAPFVSSPLHFEQLLVLLSGASAWRTANSNIVFGPEFTKNGSKGKQMTMKAQPNIIHFFKQKYISQVVLEYVLLSCILWKTEYLFL